MISRRTAMLRPLLAALLITWLGLLGLSARAEVDGASPSDKLELTLGVGVQYNDVDGNERRFDQYVTAPADGFLSLLSWQREEDRGLAFDLNVLEVGEPGPSGRLWLQSGCVALEAQLRRSAFYSEFDENSERSRRLDWDLALHSAARSDPRHAWSFQTATVKFDAQPTAGMVNWQDETTGGSFAYRSGDYWMELGFSKEEFTVLNDDGLSGDMDTFALSLSPALSSKTQITANYAHQSTDLRFYGRTVSSWNADLSMIHPLSDDLLLMGTLRRFDIDRTIVQNAYAREQTAGRLEAEYRVRPGTMLSAFWENAVTDYVDGLQLNEVDVGSDTVGVSLRSRLSDALKVTGKFARYDTEDRPLYFTVNNGMGNSVIYSTLRRLDVSASYAPSAVWGLTGQFQRHEWTNDVQAIWSNIRTVSATAWCQLLEGALSLTTSFVRQDFSLPIKDTASQLGYTSRASSVVLGANYVLSTETNLYASYADSVAVGATTNNYQRFTVGVSNDLGRGNRVLLEADLGKFSDANLDTLAYDGNLYRAEWQHQF